MTSKLDYQIDLIYEKLKKYKYRKILLEKETLKDFINTISKED